MLNNKYLKWGIIGFGGLIFLIIVFSVGFSEKKNNQPEESILNSPASVYEGLEKSQSKTEIKEESKSDSETQIESEDKQETKEGESTSELTPTPETKTDRDKMIEIFKVEALAKWDDDYSMVNYEVKKQTEAYEWVINNAKYSNILEKAKQKWSNDYAMVRYEYEKQAGAYEWINQQTAYPEIMRRAKQKWGDDYAMVKYEYEKQVKAYEAL